MLQIDMYPLFVNIARAGKTGCPIDNLNFVFRLSLHDSWLTVLRKCARKLYVVPNTAWEQTRFYIIVRIVIEYLKVSFDNTLKTSFAFIDLCVKTLP